MWRSFAFTVFYFSNILSLALPALAESTLNSPSFTRPAAIADKALQQQIIRLRRPAVTAGMRCIREGKMTALVPKQEIALTDELRATFFVYIPANYPQSDIEHLAELSLTDDQEKEVYQTRFKLTGNPGIVKLELPRTKNLTPNEPESLLELNKLYRWRFTVICDDFDWSSNPSVGGFIKRIELKRLFYGSFINAPPIGMYPAYRNFGLWDEAVLSLLGERHRLHYDKKFAKEWLEFWQAEGLEDIAQVPIISCCTLEK
ncbi:protein of unknown function (DUF928) [Cylindrospermum stagnale PCC 7417]|uniref:DUF928 domain-containing protein n=1 Tax=Cylindrospermum stagnale PCC 7417 TaxID=56107 RepID=K9X3A1_9NOST|nr:DUF928 domain-containing protein [Cylindrospermum stagnale]AFZ26541.1 protein of unknown function (DUF928) [Cylindrospermum stagnale PCC 7417]